MTPSSHAPRVIIHANDPKPLSRLVREGHGDAVVECCDSYAGLPELIDRFHPDVVFTIRFAGTPGFPTEALFGANGPRWISVGGSGVDHLGTWNSDNMIVTNAAGVAADMMAEYVLGGFLHFSLDIPGLAQDRRDRTWRQDRKVVPLRGKKLLIIGLGNTGRAIAARAKAFGMHVMGTRANPQIMENLDAVHGAEDLSTLWPQADFIAICVPLLDATRDLVDHCAFGAMKQGVVLADVSRGGVVNGDAMISSLENGKLGGAVLDVFETEPLPEAHRLWQMENVIISPHCSSVFDGWEQLSIKMFVENLSRWRNGETLHNQVPVR